MIRIPLAVFALLAYVVACFAQAPAPVLEVQQFPAGAIPITISASGTVNAVPATLAANTTKRTFICGFSYTGTNATGAQTGSVTVAGVVTGTMSFGFPTLVAGAAVAHPSPMVQSFYPCIPSSAINTAIVVTGPALGAGATLATVSAWGFQQ